MIYSRYLCYINSPDVRSIFTKLRINNVPSLSGHINKQQICPMCDMQNSANAKHVILECSKTTAARETLLVYLSHVVKQFESFSTTDKLVLILDIKVDFLAQKYDKNEFISKIAAYVKHIYHMMKNI